MKWKELRLWSFEIESTHKLKPSLKKNEPLAPQTKRKEKEKGGFKIRKETREQQFYLVLNNLTTILINLLHTLKPDFPHLSRTKHTNNNNNNNNNKNNNNKSNPLYNLP
jgi:hypothetical protein